MAFKGGSAKAVIDITARTTRGLHRAVRSARSALRSVGKVAKAAGVAAGAGLAATALVARKAIKAYAVQEDAERKLAAVVKSTGQAAGFTAKQLYEQAAALQKVTTFGDEAIMPLQAILATFKKIKGDTFTRATEAVLDLSVALGTDARSAAIQLGKALNDPIKGVTALSRAGVQFSESQRETIKQLVKSNEILKAQDIILSELEGQFGGVARELSKTAAGQWKQFTNAVGDLWEKLGKLLLPTVQAVTGVLNDMLPTIEAVGDMLAKKLTPYIEAAAEKIKEFGKGFTLDAVIGKFKKLKQIMGMIKEGAAATAAMLSIIGNAILVVITTSAKTMGKVFGAFASIQEFLTGKRADKLRNIADTLQKPFDNATKRLKQSVKIYKDTAKEFTKLRMQYTGEIPEAPKATSSVMPTGLLQEYFTAQDIGQSRRAAAIARRIREQNAAQGESLGGVIGGKQDETVRLLKIIAEKTNATAQNTSPEKQAAPVLL